MDFLVSWKFSTFEPIQSAPNSPFVPQILKTRPVGFLKLGLWVLWPNQKADNDDKLPQKKTATEKLPAGIFLLGAGISLTDRHGNRVIRRGLSGAILEQRKLPLGLQAVTMNEMGTLAPTDQT